MIDEIQVKDLALIREGSLAPSRNLTVLTGETGAGKTALLSAMKLLMGARARVDAIRDGCSELQVSGSFYGLQSCEAECGKASEGGSFNTDDSPAGEAVVTRSMNTEGRSRVRIDGRLASVHELARMVGPSIDLCGQFEHQRLMASSSHVDMLDGWAGSPVQDAMAEYAQAFTAALEAAAELDRIRQNRDASTARLDEARFILARIDEVSPQPGEYEELKQALAVAENAEALARAVGEARAALADDDGALDSVNRAAGALEAVGEVDGSLTKLAASVREAGYILEDAASEVRTYQDGLEFDPATLQFQQERLSALQGLIRNYGPRMEDVLNRREQAAELVGVVEDAGTFVAAAEARQRKAEEALQQAADKLDAARKKAAPAFADAVNEVMARLQMGGAQLVCQFEELPRERWSEKGPSRFEFLYTPVADGSPRPLTRIASGGEVSRVMLALKVVLGATDQVDTLVFDEVDAGVGGAVAVALAEELAVLARTHQVIVVTHLAQVAVRADTHYVVRRQGDRTEIVPVVGEERVREVARMLSGSATEASLAHARELLEC